MSAAPDDLDSLFAAPPAGFIAERKRIVAALKGAGRKDDAKAVEKIPRPSLPLWTVNQIARRDPELVRRLGEVTQRLQTAPGAEYAAAAVEHRQVLHQLRDRASEILSAAGHELTPQVILRAIANLRAAAGSPDTRATLEQGRMVQDLAEQASENLFGTAAAPAAPDDGAPSPATTEAGAAPAPTAAADPAATAPQARVRTKEIIDAERAVKRLRADEAAARKKVDRAERAVTAARESLAVVEVHAATARAAAEAATQARADAEATLARLSGG